MADVYNESPGMLRRLPKWAYAFIGGALLASAAMAADPAATTDAARASATTAPSTPASTTLPATAPTPAPMSATAAAAQALGIMHDKILNTQCRGHFDYGAKLLRLSPSKLKGVCVLLPGNAVVISQGPLSKRMFIAALSYPIQQLAGVRGQDSIAVNESRIEKVIKKYGLIQMALNTPDQTGAHVSIPMPIASKPIVIETDYDMGPFDAFAGGVFKTPDIFIVIGTQSLTRGDGRVLVVPILRLLGTPEVHHIAYPQDPNLFPS